jgi:hypothetical protein
VPDVTWEKIKPAGKAQGAGLICGACIMNRIEAIGEYGAVMLPADVMSDRVMDVYVVTLGDGFELVVSAQDVSPADLLQKASQYVKKHNFTRRNGLPFNSPFAGFKYQTMRESEYNGRYAGNQAAEDFLHG